MTNIALIGIDIDYWGCFFQNFGRWV